MTSCVNGLNKPHMFMMSQNDGNHQKKSAFPPYVSLPFMTKQRCSSAAATSKLHQNSGSLIPVLSLVPRQWFVT